MSKTNIPHPERTDTDELPIVLSDGPTAGDKYVAIQEGECGRCGYDRIRVSAQYGERWRTCMACDASADGSGNWELPDSDADLRDRCREAADWDGPVEAAGRVSLFRRGEIETFVHQDTDLVKAFVRQGEYRSGVERLCLRDETLRGLLSTLEDHNGFVSDFVDEEIDNKQVRPQVSGNPNTRNIYCWADPGDWMAVTLAIDSHRELMDSVAHIPPSREGLSL